MLVQVKAGRTAGTRPSVLVDAGQRLRLVAQLGPLLPLTPTLRLVQSLNPLLTLSLNRPAMRSPRIGLNPPRCFPWRSSGKLCLPMRESKRNLSSGLTKPAHQSDGHEHPRRPAPVHKEELDTKTRTRVSSAGGKARAKTLTADQRIAIAKDAANRRWKARRTTSTTEEKPS